MAGRFLHGVNTDMVTLPTLDAADDYHELRANTAWQNLEAEVRMAALYKAQDYLTYYEFKDYSTESAEVVAKNDALVQRAIIMLAPEMVGSASIAATPLVLKESSSIKQGLVAESKEYVRPSADRFPQVTALLQPILVSSKLGGSGLIRIVRN